MNNTLYRKLNFCFIFLSSIALSQYAHATDYLIKISDDKSMLITGQLHSGQHLSLMQDNQYISQCDFTNDSANSYLNSMKTGLDAWQESDEIHIQYTHFLHNDDIDNNGCKIQKPKTSHISLVFQTHSDPNKKLNYKTNMLGENGDVLDNHFIVQVSPIK